MPITRSDAKVGRLSSGIFTLVLFCLSSGVCVNTRNGIIGWLLSWCRSLLAPLTRGYSIALLVTEAGAKETKVRILAREVGCFARNLRTVPERYGKPPGLSQAVWGPGRLPLEILRSGLCRVTRTGITTGKSSQHQTNGDSRRLRCKEQRVWTNHDPHLLVSFWPRHVDPCHTEYNPGGTTVAEISPPIFDDPFIPELITPWLPPDP